MPLPGLSRVISTVTLLLSALSPAYASESIATAAQNAATLARFEKMRHQRQITQQPDLIRLAFGSDQSHFDAAVNDSSGTVDFGTRPGKPVWSVLTTHWARSDTTSTRYAFAAAGRHVPMGKHWKGGAMVQIEHALRDVSPSQTQGDGWMLGPYLVGQIPGTELSWSMQALTGQGRVATSPLGQQATRATSNRTFVRGRIEGSLELGALELTPNILALQVSGRTPKMRNRAGAIIPAQRVQISQLSAGLDFDRSVPVRALGAITVKGGLSLNAQRSQGTALAATIMPRSDGYSSRFEIGLDYEDDTFGILRTELGIDGAEGAPLDTVGLSLSWEYQL
ncbi:hypothetical protein BFP70_00585 [Thioclava sp. SK-1]|uniref:autotransporter domain-containing protein n=1 Tax=Thioclava sp. SK-1 TaxID=1889770 RepID=UPI00082506C3|nr:autotransporter domain-containing protein [Thioclava sp. SK-1]OCX66692.1 hypothetical protein BFP70_00585 [Thioclava sp. SK-1]